MEVSDFYTFVYDVISLCLVLDCEHFLWACACWSVCLYVCVPVCLSVSAAWFCLHAICTKCELLFFFHFFSVTYYFCKFVHVSVSKLVKYLMFVNISCVSYAFQTNTPGGGGHNREAGRRVHHHPGPQPQRRPLMVPSIGQYGKVVEERKVLK